MFGKIDVNGAGAHPLYWFLKGEAKGVMGTGEFFEVPYRSKKLL
jgi:glutathione peroxidase-family protein